jgi:hypothetical protein
LNEQFRKDKNVGVAGGGAAEGVADTLRVAVHVPDQRIILAQHYFHWLAQAFEEKKIAGRPFLTLLYY